MGAVANAAALATDPEFRDRALAALVYQARNVIADEGATARAQSFARQVVRAPMSYAETVAWVMAADPQVASLGATAASVPEDTLLGRVLSAWDYLSGALGPYPS